MPNMSLTKVPMPEQDPNVRNKNFEEVALGYTKEMAMEEATRCINCKNKPCMSGCPVCVRIPEFIAKVAAGEFEEAYKIITSTNGLPAVCGRVCPQENQCEGKCIRGIKGEPVSIGRLERFVADYHMAHSNDDAVKPESNGIKVAVVGAGPAGLTCAGDLAKLGYEVTIFEAFHKAGGVLVYGIPEFRLPKAIVQKEVENLEALGVKVETDMVIGRVLSIDEIMEMGNLCGQAIMKTCQLLASVEVREAATKEIGRIEKEIDDKEHNIEALCMQLLLKQQPVGTDLRKISAALKMVTDMERIGDQATDIAEILNTGSVHIPVTAIPLQEMADYAMHMVNDSVTAYVEEKSDLAKKVISSDDILDNLFNKVRNALDQNTMDFSSDEVLDLLMISKYYERIGDHATNIGEWAEFSVDGIHRNGDSISDLFNPDSL